MVWALLIFRKQQFFFTFITEIINDLLGGCNKCCCVVVAHHCSSVQNQDGLSPNAWFPLLLEDSGTQRTALLRKHFPLDKNVAKKVGNAIACGGHPQVRKCRRHAGGIAMRCVVMLRNPYVIMETTHYPLLPYSLQDYNTIYFC